MKQQQFNLRKVATIVACLAVTTIFPSCDSGNLDDDEGGGNGKVWVDKKGGKTQRFAKLDDAFLPIRISGPGEYTIRIGENQHITSRENFFVNEDQIITMKAESGTVEITCSHDILYHFTVSFGTTVILDKGIIIKGLNEEDGYGGITVYDKGKLIMNEGAKIIECGGTAVLVETQGIFEMNGGTICDNLNFGVSLGNGTYNEGFFTMNGGSISDNGFVGSGYPGVGIDNGTFTMNDGVISGNADCGVSMSDGKFTMKKGSIINNMKRYNGGKDGGGVHVSFSSTFTMDGGEISGHTVRSGGGVFVGGDARNRGTFIMNGGTIAKNKAEDGGGVYINSYADFTMNGGTISGNTAEKCGGGVYISNNVTFIKTGKSIIYGENGGSNANKALTGLSGIYGHAAYVNSSSVKRDLTAGEEVVMRWSYNGATKQGWDN